jgi:2-iminobutanoate/2-iminopropanoate deaminase
VKLIVDPDKARDKFAYSPALKFGDFVMVAGQAPISLDGKIIPGTIEEETRLTMNNVKKLIEAAGATMDQVVQCNCFLATLTDFDAFDATFREFFSDHLPCRTTVGTNLLGFKIEINAMAYVGP